MPRHIAPAFVWTVSKPRFCSSVVRALFVPGSSPSLAHHLAQVPNSSDERTRVAPGQAAFGDEPADGVGLVAVRAGRLGDLRPGSPSPFSRQSW